MKATQPTYLLVTACLCFITMQFSVYGQNAWHKPRGVSARIKNVEGMSTGDKKNNWTLKSRMAYYHVIGLSIAVIHNYKIEWVKGYGWANAARTIPVTTKTLFQAGSISKSINSVGVLKLVQDNKISLDADINRYLKTWKFPYDSVSKGRKITVANLLSHTAGLSVHGFNGYERGTSIPTIYDVLDGRSPANNKPVRSIFEPGIKFEYSGGGITITQRIITDISGMTYEQFMYQNVLKPMGMLNSTYAQTNVDSDGRPLSTGFDKNGQPIPGQHHIYPEQAAAGLWTNPTDLAKYIIETQLAYEGRSAKVLSQKITKLRLTPYLTPYSGLGVFIDDRDNTRYFEHGGDDAGFTAQYFGSFENGNGLVIMVNSDNVAIIQEIVNRIAKVYSFKGLVQ